MRPVNIYALTRLDAPELLSKVEKQLSRRGRAMKIRSWEIEGLRLFSEKLQDVYSDACSLMFFYSFTMQKLGKEFDLLRISDELVVNIELKSGNVSNDAVRSQLIQNKYYLATLGRSMYFYTYISGQDRLVRLSNSGRLVNCSFEELASVLEKQGGCLDVDIDDLFKTDKYLLSPLTDPARFLRREYFLTSQQRDIKKQILKGISEGHMLHGFTGLPGTGKTILLYDIAMQLSHRNPVCVFYFGPRRTELHEFDERLKRIDFYPCDRNSMPGVSREYAAIFVDEGHGMGEGAFSEILTYGKKWSAPVIISYDNVDCVSKKERAGIGSPVIEAAEGFKGYRLTNRIRLNNELSAFLRSLFSAPATFKREYPNVTVTYGRDQEEASRLIMNHEREGYMFIWDRSLGTDYDRTDEFPGEGLTRIESATVTGREFDKVVMLLDDTFYYDERGFLRNRESESQSSPARIMNLFHGLSRAKEKIAIVVKDNMTVMEQIYRVLQR